MKVLVACEESQVVCIAFRERGHEAYSCDIQESSGGHPEWHLQMGIFTAIKNHGPFDLLIAFPPCTRLTYAGQWQMKDPEKFKERKKAMKFFYKIYDCGIPKIVIENPQGIMQRVIKASQKIEPYYFGAPDRKRTLLWLRNVPPLMFGALNPKGLIPDKIYIRKTSSKNGGPKAGGKIGIYFMNRNKGGKNRGKKRSKTFPEVANAMAEQWG